MKLPRWAKFLLGITLAVWLSVSHLTVMAQEVIFDIYKQEILGEVQSNGDVKFTDQQYYDVQFMNGAIFTLDHKGYQLSQYRVGVKNLENNTIEYLTEAYSGARGTYQLTTRNEVTEFKVFYPTQDEKVVFVYEYTLVSLITNYEDVAVLNRRVVGENTPFWQDVTATIVLPGEVTVKEDLRAWGHGAPQGTVTLGQQEQRSTITVDVLNNPANQMVELLVLFPTSLTPNNPNVIQEKMKDTLIERENKQVEQDAQAQQKRYLWQKAKEWGTALCIPILPMVSLLYYFKRRKSLNPHPVQLPKYIYDLPEDITPAIMACAVLRSAPNSDDFAATVVDLARKGYVTIEEVRKEKRGLFTSGASSTVRIQPTNQKDLTALRAHERRALEFVVHKNWTMEQIDQRMEVNHGFQKRQAKIWQQFVDYASLKGEQLSDTARGERMVSTIMSVSGMIVAVVLTLFAVGFAQQSRSVGNINFFFALGGISFVASGIGVVLNIVRPLRSAKEDTMLQEWRGFGNMLRDIGQFNMREIASLPIWEEYLVYAMSLGVADTVLSVMKDQFTVEELDTSPFVRQVYVSPHIYTRVLGQSVQSSIHSSQPVDIHFSGTNSGGFGGGFSSGSSGGSGGGSGSGGF